jgi:hypothetical protein
MYHSNPSEISVGGSTTSSPVVTLCCAAAAALHAETAKPMAHVETRMLPPLLSFAAELQE